MVVDGAGGVYPGSGWCGGVSGSGWCGGVSGSGWCEWGLVVVGGVDMGSKW